MQPISNKRFWFYSQYEPYTMEEAGSIKEWLRLNLRGTDEYGHHTFVIPLGKGRAVCIAYRAGYKKLWRCEDCVESRKQTLEFEQDALYVQTYWNIEDYDDVFDLDDKRWDYALGVHQHDWETSFISNGNEVCGICWNMNTPGR